MDSPYAQYIQELPTRRLPWETLCHPPKLTSCLEHSFLHPPKARWEPIKTGVNKPAQTEEYPVSGESEVWDDIARKKDPEDCRRVQRMVIEADDIGDCDNENDPDYRN